MDHSLAEIDLLAPGPVRHVRLDLTSRCNLRCVYCAVSRADYQGEDMPGAMIRRAITTIVGLARAHPIEPVDLNGHGETTFVDGWTDVCFEMAEKGIPTRLTTNLAKNFSDTELQALAGMTSIAVSIDTADRARLARLRRRVDVRQIVWNITRIRQVALAQHRKAPGVVFLCGLYDQNAAAIEELAQLAIACAVEGVSFWSLTAYRYDNTDVPERDQVRPLDELDDADLRPRLLAICAALKLLRRHGVVANVQGDFVSRLGKRVNLDVRQFLA